MQVVAPRIEEFAGQMLAGLPRRDQRAKGEWYLRGLLLDGQRKSMQPMAERLGVDHQGLQQFISSSTWDDAAVRRRLAGWAEDFIEPRAWVLDDTGFVKDGHDSPGVARQYSGTLGKTANCQIGVSLHAATDWASAAVNWRLFLPASWDDQHADTVEAAATIRRRRGRARIGEQVRHREKWRLALDMLDEATNTWQLPTHPVVADSGYGDATAFRLGLAQRGLHYVVAVGASTSAQPGDAVVETPEYSGTGRPPRPGYPSKPASLRELALAAGRKSLHQVTWRHGSKKTPNNRTGAMRSRFLTLRVRPANRQISRDTDGSLPACWMLAEWPAGEPEPTDYWMSNLDADTPLRELVQLAKLRWRVEHDYRELKHGLGLDHFEGRSLAGWYRHVTLVSLAQAIGTQLRYDPKAPAPA
ncbi:MULTISPECIES: IS701 family transposase [unclassified Actinopolyspora]|uniref:IS701 family transposase n=1 Tax=unclassified Actinopolyspora TaxID=2639451 RepID=UPI0013F5F538|nr:MULTISPECIES: IS701 family transposase [unclassified Actinopolyspora]NHD19584.1 IS701 family transposase [Actinopolyspora sp. BKK2]NHE78740.1 IS701 family transposase [Actinopolyspora sp. BKK1]